MNGEAGKGDSPRPVDQKRYRRNYDRLYGQNRRRPTAGRYRIVNGRLIPMRELQGRAT